MSRGDRDIPAERARAPRRRRPPRDRLPTAALPPAPLRARAGCREYQRGRRPAFSSRPRISVDHAVQRPLADLAEEVGAREHDAVGFGPEITLRFVHRPFVSADHAAILRKQRLVPLAFLLEERFHFGFGPPLLADLGAPCLRFPRQL